MCKECDSMSLIHIETTCIIILSVLLSAHCRILSSCLCKLVESDEPSPGQVKCTCMLLSKAGKMFAVMGSDKPELLTALKVFMKRLAGWKQCKHLDAAHKALVKVRQAAQQHT